MVLQSSAGAYHKFCQDSSFPGVLSEADGISRLSIGAGMRLCCPVAVCISSAVKTAMLREPACDVTLGWQRHC